MFNFLNRKKYIADIFEEKKNIFNTIYIYKEMERELITTTKFYSRYMGFLIQNCIDSHTNIRFSFLLFKNKFKL